MADCRELLETTWRRKLGEGFRVGSLVALRPGGSLRPSKGLPPLHLVGLICPADMRHSTYAENERSKYREALWTVGRELSRGVYPGSPPGITSDRAGAPP